MVVIVTDYFSANFSNTYLNRVIGDKLLESVKFALFYFILFIFVVCVCLFFIFYFILLFSIPCTL